MNDYTIEARERFRKKMGEYFYLIGDLEAFEDIQTESEERLILDAYHFAIYHFEECMKELKGKETT